MNEDKNKAGEVGLEPTGKGKLDSSAASIDSNDELKEDSADEMSDGFQKVKLRKPITFDGELIESIVLDLDSLTTGDLQRAEREANMRLKKTKQRLSSPKELDSKYTAIVAAKAAKVKLELLDKLYAQDFTTITMLTSNFLLGGESLE